MSEDISAPHDRTAITASSLLVEEEKFVATEFGLDEAWRLGTILRDEAENRHLPVAIEIALGGCPVFFARVGAATEDNRFWIKRKRAVVERFFHSSLYMRVLAEESRFDFNDRFRIPRDRFAASGGSIPIFGSSRNLIGTITISGLPDIDDHELASRVLLEFLGADG